jgi:hypothetical protein
MPIVDFAALPDSARIWIFASDTPLTGAAADTLLAAVDHFLSGWKAHGVPLTCARDWRDGRFLAIGVDVTAESASGCSIDGLFRTLREIEREVGTRLVGGGRVFYRTRSGIQTATRDEFVERIRAGDIAWETPVFDTSVTEVADWRSRFETPAGIGWTAGFWREAGRGKPQA